MKVKEKVLINRSQRKERKSSRRKRKKCVSLTVNSWKDRERLTNKEKQITKREKQRRKKKEKRRRCKTKMAPPGDLKMSTTSSGVTLAQFWWPCQVKIFGPTKRAMSTASWTRCAPLKTSTSSGMHPPTCPSSVISSKQPIQRSSRNSWCKNRVPMKEKN